MVLTINSKVKLNNGVEMPLFGLGVYLTDVGRTTQDAVRCALDHGYRLIDTAKAYENEKDVGNAVRESGIPRKEIFITTKLWNTDHGYGKALRAFQRSLDELGTDYIDLYLIHWPVERIRHESWEALTTLLKEGKCRAIGVSNYMIGHLEELLDKSSVVPAVNQVEFSPFLYLKDLHNFCVKKGVQLESYSPLTRGRLFKNQTVSRLSAKYKKTPAQIMIRWALEHGVVVIPKSAHPERIRENADVFDFCIDQSDMTELDGLNANFRTSWDPTKVR
jgi:methylglyoxal/glyoxal reductase